MNIIWECNKYPDFSWKKIQTIRVPYTFVDRDVYELVGNNQKLYDQESDIWIYTNFSENTMLIHLFQKK